MLALKTIAHPKLSLIVLSLTIIALTACKSADKEKTSLATPNETNSLNTTTPQKERVISQSFKDYWFSGTAEITSYRLEQARYGEIRLGNAALIFVTEDFLPEAQVKADRSDPTNISILKLNATKTFTTGIYPYSIMSSTFYPVFKDTHALKVSQSMQEWCGHVYVQLNNRNQYEIDSHSYFEGEADQHFSLDKVILENELWTQLRIDPSLLPTGTFEAIPDLSFVRLKHVDLKAYQAKGTLTKDSYSIEYPSLQRSLMIHFETDFPHKITAWEETFKSGFGAKAKTMTSKAIAIKTIKSAYWGKNSTADDYLRKDLGLE